LSADFHAKLKDRAADGKTNMLTTDGVHMNASGSMVMAAGVLHAFGLDEMQVQKAEEAWKDIPGGGRMSFGFGDTKGKSLQGTLNATIREREKLEALAAKEGKKVDEMLQVILAEEARKFLKPAGEFGSVAAIFDAGKDQEIQSALQEKFSQRARALLKEQR
jgi:hypothetical protein